MIAQPGVQLGLRLAVLGDRLHDEGGVGERVQMRRHANLRRRVASRGARRHREQRVMREDEEGAAIGSAEQDLYRTLGHIYFTNRRAASVIDENLSVRDVDVALDVHGGALAAAIDERIQIAQRAVGLHDGAARAVL